MVLVLPPELPSETLQDLGFGLYSYQKHMSTSPLSQIFHHASEPSSGACKSFSQWAKLHCRPLGGLHLPHWLWVHNVTRLRKARSLADCTSVFDMANRLGCDEDRLGEQCCAGQSRNASDSMMVGVFTHLIQNIFYLHHERHHHRYYNRLAYYNCLLLLSVSLFLRPSTHCPE